MDKKVAMIWGITGQDGAYLSELLTNKDYYVVGVQRRSSTPTDYRLKEVDIKKENFEMVHGEITDAGCVYRLINHYKPDELYNLAAMSHVRTSFDEPRHCLDVDAGGHLNILEAVKDCSSSTRISFAATSELMGKSKGKLKHFEMNEKGEQIGHVYMQDENTPFIPQSPYAIAKLAAYHYTRLYRQSYGLHASNSICFNHESPLRQDTFVTRKITKYIGELTAFAKKHGKPLDGSLTNDGLFSCLLLGNINASRDWGHARDYVRAMWMILQQPVGDDYVIASSTSYSVKDFLREAFLAVGINDYTSFVRFDSSLLRPSEVDYLCGDYSKAKKVLGWEPQINFRDLVKEMVEYDIKKASSSI